MQIISRESATFTVNFHIFSAKVDSVIKGSENYIPIQTERYTC